MTEVAIRAEGRKFSLTGAFITQARFEEVMCSMEVFGWPIKVVRWYEKLREKISEQCWVPIEYSFAGEGPKTLYHGEPRVSIDEHLTSVAKALKAELVEQ